MWARESRDASWAFLSKNLDRIIARLSPRRASRLPSLAIAFCSHPQVQRTGELFATRAKTLAGGPRELKLAVERLTLCSQLKDKQLPAVRRYLSKRR